MLLLNNRADASEEEWAPVSDLMAVLMLIFMFIAIVFVRSIVLEKQDFRQKCDEIFRSLDEEFRKDFDDWQAELDRDLTMRFKNPEVLFETGSDEIRPRFTEILSNFFPRYLKTVAESKDDILEIRIEGHTSSEYGGLQKEEAYLQNMRLSQDRTVAILTYLLSQTNIRPQDRAWARDLLTANGLSSSKLVDYNGELTKISGKDEDKIASRRVEFRLVAGACQKAGAYRNE